MQGLFKKGMSFLHNAIEVRPFEIPKRKHFSIKKINIV